jgi:hypothetical protein
MTSHKGFGLYTGLPQLWRAKLKECLTKKVVENPVLANHSAWNSGRSRGTTEESVTRCAIQMANLGGGGHEDGAAFLFGADRLIRIHWR